ncbi:MAG: aminotransferase class IV [Holosporaceae bacterium]|nr:MAG: aminotransferase class IV [Holosporaceae bacterium]
MDAAAHFERLDRSLGELSIEKPYASHASLLHKIRYLKRCNQIDEGFVYMQISRGIAPRNHCFQMIQNLLFYADEAPPLSPFVSKKIRTERDGRWHRCDIKTTNLLPNVLAKQSAFEKGLFDTWGVTDDGMVTEGPFQMLGL